MTSWGIDMRGMSLVIATFLAIILVTSCSVAQSAAEWSPGDEADIFGHTFEEESWYSTATNKTKDNDTAEFGISYVNMGDIESFLITLNKITDEEGNMGTLPYQMFGMHYFTEEGKEVFVGALLAFLCVYNDTDENDVPSPGENFFYVIPFGLGNVINGTYPPTVSNHEVTKISDDHYQMGITYTNLYAIASENPIASAYLLTGWVLQFSELTITYNIEIDRETGILTTETYYTIGQISTLYAVILGIPIPANDIQGTIPDNFGIGAVHFTTIFTSNYKVMDQNGAQLNTNRDQEVEGNIEVHAGDERAFSVGLRGDYDLIDEDSDTTLEEDLEAQNMILKAKFSDLILVGWQLGFSANVFAHMAYGLSEHVRANWATPGILASDSTRAIGPKGFGAHAFWYGVFFPGWDGYRVYHDPVYTAYFAEPPEEPIIGEEGTPGFEMLLILVGLAAVPIIKSVHFKRR
jgi:hypothetical protein